MMKKTTRQHKSNYIGYFFFVLSSFLFSRLTMESTDSTIGMTSLALSLDSMTEFGRSRTSLLSGTSDDPSFQLNEVSNYRNTK